MSFNELSMNAPNDFTGPDAGNLTILQRVAKGDKSAFDECIKSYNGLVWKIARKYANTNQDAEDAVQEAFLAIWKNAHRFDPAISPEWSFVGLIAQRNSISNYRKSRLRNSDVSLTNFDQEKHFAHPYEKINMRLEIKPLMKAMSRLSSSEIRLINLSIFAGNSHTEISEKIGMPLGTVKSHIRRGLDKIRRSINYLDMALPNKN